MAKDDMLVGLSQDPGVWEQRVDLNLTLFQALTIQGLLGLALRHPSVRGPSLAREAAEDTVAILSRMLVHGGGLSEATLQKCFEGEAHAGAMTWDDFEAACARIEARVAARGQQNPDDSWPLAARRLLQALQHWLLIPYIREAGETSTPGLLEELEAGLVALVGAPPGGSTGSAETPLAPLVLRSVERDLLLLALTELAPSIGRLEDISSDVVAEVGPLMWRLQALGA